MSKEKIEMSVELNGQEVVAYPYVNSDHVLLDNNMTIDKMLESDVVEPVITHEEVSFKVGQGDSDLSDSIVDSSAGGFTIKGQTYQNILPEPSTHVLSNNKEMFKVNEGLDSNVEIVDGVSKSAILKGQTLVNLCWDVGRTWSTSSDYSITKEDNYTTLTVLSTDYWYQPSIKQGGLLKPSTDYLVIVDVLENTLTTTFSLTGNSKYGKFVSDVTKRINAGQIGVFKFKMQTKSEFIELGEVNYDVYMQFGKAENVGNKIKFRIMVLEYQQGMENWDIPYFEGMQSVRMPVLTTTGKNLFNLDDNLHCLNRLDNGRYHSTPHKAFSVPKLKPNTAYTLSFSVSEFIDETLQFPRINYTDGSVQVLYRADGTFNGNPAFIMKSNPNKTISHFDFSYGTNNKRLEFIDFQIEEGDISTSYEPYKSNILTVNEDVTLRSNGSVCDELDLLTGKLTQRIDEDGEILTQEVVKTVDLSSSGNWEKVVYNGQQNWYVNSKWSSGDILACHTDTVENKLIGGLAYGSSLQGMNYSEGCVVNNVASKECVKYDSGSAVLYILIKKSKLPSPDANGLKQYLSQNPETIWYQTATHQDSTQVKQPIFFKDGHIQLSSGADHSLIPTLDYQTKTSNSYVMDLMKTNTRYTMKAKSASGTFTIDGTSYGAGTNGTFTTPSSMTNKFLVMSNKTNEEVMILEGDVTSKAIPYFKGIKSAFENESKIEVLSTGKNLFDVNLIYGAHTYGNVGLKPTHGTGYARVTNETGDYILVKPNTKYTFSIGNNFSFAIAQLDKDGISLGDTGWLNNKSSWTITTQSTARYIGFNIRKLDDSDITADEVYKAYPMFEESLSATTYEPYKSNSTKIPLLSPLRSLPNGVRDEVIVDRESNKAKIIQRVSEELMKLATPVITEVDLEGFPYIYKDGHIFLNSEIAPTTTIKYSINQAQVIQSQNSDIIRHSKEITNLHRLISEYVQVQYESTLLNLKVKMRA